MDAPGIELGLLSELLLDRLRLDGRCTACQSLPDSPSVDLVRIAFDASSSLKSEYRMLPETLRRTDDLALEEGTLTAAIEVVLRRHTGPMSYGDIRAEVNSGRIKKFSADSVWRRLQVCSFRGRDILLWDRGGVYQHRCHVDLDAPVFRKIEDWVVATLV